jgi:hypothetical protein
MEFADDHAIRHQWPVGLQRRRRFHGPFRLYRRRRRRLCDRTNWTLDIGYRYVDAGSVFTNGIITTVGGDEIQDTPIKTRLRTDEGAVTLRWTL